MNTKLELCPYCNSEIKIVSFEYALCATLISNGVDSMTFYEVYCPGCWIDIGLWETEEECASAWNDKVKTGHYNKPYGLRRKQAP